MIKYTDEPSELIQARILTRDGIKMEMMNNLNALNIINEHKAKGHHIIDVEVI